MDRDSNPRVGAQGQQPPLPKVPEHPMALAAQRLVSDGLVQDFFNRLEETFTIAALQGPDPAFRESHRQQLMALYGLVGTLKNFADGQVPAEYRQNAPSTDTQI